MTSPPEPTDPLAALLDARIRAAVEAKVAELQKPTHVTQRAVLAVVGVPATTYLEAARAGAIDDKKRPTSHFGPIILVWDRVVNKTNDLEATCRCRA